MKRSRLLRGAPKGRKSLYTRLLGALRMSEHNKKKHGWSRDVGAGFIVDDLLDIEPVGKSSVRLKFGWGGEQTTPIPQLNLRETEEAIKFLKHKMWKEGEPE